jgi:hypothetical protein
LKKGEDERSSEEDRRLKVQRGREKMKGAVRKREDERDSEEERR